MDNTYKISHHKGRLWGTQQLIDVCIAEQLVSVTQVSNVGYNPPQFLKYFIPKTFRSAPCDERKNYHNSLCWAEGGREGPPSTRCIIFLMLFSFDIRGAAKELAGFPHKTVESKTTFIYASSGPLFN